MTAKLDLELLRMQAALERGEIPEELPPLTEDEQRQVSSSAPAARPDGSTAKLIGVCLLVGGIILSVIAESMSVTTYSFTTDIDPSKLATKAKLALAGGAFFKTGLLIWIAGYIVNAISFLPGRRK